MFPKWVDRVVLVSMINKGNSAHSPPLCMPPQRTVLESLRLPGPVLVQMPQPSVTCSSRPRTPCSILSPTYSYEEEYCNAATCCSSNSCIRSQPVMFCPFGNREEPPSCRGPCQTCMARRNEVENCKGMCREPPPTCKRADASTDAAIRFYVDHQTSGEIIPPQSHSMPCFTDEEMDDLCPNMQEPAPIPSAVPLCCRQQTNALPSSTGSSICKSGPCSITPNLSMSATGGAGAVRKQCCPISDATFGSGQQIRPCAFPPMQQSTSNIPNNSIANGSFQKLAATSTSQIKDKKRKKSESKLDEGTGTCTQSMCPANTMECPCRFPPAFSQFECTGDDGGTCRCTQNK